MSIRQPWIRPIVRGKVKAPWNLGQSWMSVLAKKDMDGWKKISFDAYNESGCLIGEVEHYKSRTGH